MLERPVSCRDCQLYTRGRGFSYPSGPPNSKILIIGESLGSQEVIEGRGFVGPAGDLLDRTLWRAGIDRDDCRIFNVIQCQPPSNKLEGQYYEKSAILNCRQYLEPVLAEGHGVVIAMGGLAMRALLELPRKKNITVKMFHGTVNRDPTNRFWVIPTYHTSFLLQGSHKYTNVVISDLILAKNVADNGFIPDEPKLVVDPDLRWFINWVAEFKCKLAKNSDLWLSVDIETPEKSADEDDLEVGKFTSADITRINFSYSTSEGITVPFEGPYLTIIEGLLVIKCRKAFWNKGFDVPRLEAAGFPVAPELHDAMDCWHMLQSDIPMALGFVAPFYSKWYKPWKHLAETESAKYAAIDAVQTQRCIEGLEQDLKDSGQWDIYLRHMYDLDRLAYAPATEVGVLLDKDKLFDLQTDLAEKRTGFVATLEKLAPEEILPLKPPKGRKTEPKDKPEYFARKVAQLVYDCTICEDRDVPQKHSCRKKELSSNTVASEREVSRWFRRGEFNPASPKQVMSYIKFKGHKPGKSRSTRKESTGVDTIESLAKRTKDPFYINLGKLRKIDKVLGTYIQGFIDRMDEDGRVHPKYSHRPSTLRASSYDPNFQNVIKQHGEDEFQLGDKFRACIVAGPGCKLLELDLSAVEAVEVGWFAGDPTYIRLARISIHSFLCSHIVGEPADLTWPNDELTRYLKCIKKKFKIPYERSKRVIHGSNYLLSPKGMHLYYPDTFLTIGSAEEIQDMYFSIAPSIPIWQKSVQERAHRQKYLGGSDHPFRYKHHFHNVYNYTRITKQEAETAEALGRPVAEIRGRWYAVSLGSDGKRCVAYYPQSTTSGMLKEAMLRLFNPDHSSYIGDAYFGRTPLRAPIHDSLFFEVEDKRVDEVLEKVVKEMTAPITQQPCPEEWGLEEYLTVGIEANIGTSWDAMQEIEI